jgi:hypothetical protein
VAGARNQDPASEGKIVEVNFEDGATMLVEQLR